MKVVRHLSPQTHVVIVRFAAGALVLTTERGHPTQTVRRPSVRYACSCGTSIVPGSTMRRSLIWLPEMSQPAVNITMREIHLQLRALGESLDAATAPQRDTPERRRLYHARAALRGRSGAAAARLGTSRPSELGRVLWRLSSSAYARRGKLLGGLRLLPAGHFFDGERDIYPMIVDGWSEVARCLPHRREIAARAGT